MVLAGTDLRKHIGKANKPMGENDRAKMKRRKLVVIDEAGQATEPMSVIAMNLLAETGRLALVGDR